MRERRLFFALVAAACFVAAVSYVTWAALDARARQTAREQATAQSPAASPIGMRKPYVVFRSLDRSRSPLYGEIAFASKAQRAKRRTTGLICDRVHFAAGRGLCLARVGRLFSYRARILGPDLRVRGELALTGFPSRARVSPDGRVGAATTFVSGHSYAEPGAFSTRTVIFDLVRGAELGELEEFTVSRAGRTIDAPDFNFWGVTFARDGRRFYATLATGGRTYLIEGNVRRKTARVLHENVECPSLSPDNTRIAYKMRVGEGSMWRLHVLRLATGVETALAEPRQIDDQVEWLDDERILYGVGEEIWVARADGQGRPRRFLAAADSPAVVRPAS